MADTMENQFTYHSYAMIVGVGKQHFSLRVGITIWA